MRKLLTVLRDDRGGEVTAQAAVCTAVFVLSAVLCYHWRRWRDTLLGLVVVGIKKDNLMFERNFARDTLVFRPLTATDAKTRAMVKKKTYAQTHRLETVNPAMEWQWHGDERVFLLPVALVKHMRDVHFVRDILACITTLYLAGKREGRKVITTFREICRLLNVSVNGEVCDRIENALAMLRMYTIQAQDVPLKLNQRGGVAEWGKVTFGFVDYTVVVTAKGDEKEPLPLNQRRVEVVLSEKYTALLEMKKNGRDLLCSIPVTALAAARKLPRRQVPHAKNLVYYVSGRGGKARMTLDTIVDAAALRPSRPSRAREAAENLLKAMACAGCLEYQTDGDYYLVQLKRPGVVTQ